MERRAKAVFDKYANFITASPETTADVEMLCKYLSYFVSGKLTDNAIFSEGLFTLSHLLVLFNDQIIRRQLTKGEPKISNETEENIKLFLTILENVEVLLEITSKQVLGHKRRFFIIFIIQTVKCIGRLILVVKYKNRISKSPAIEQLDRKNLNNYRTSAGNPLQPEINNDTSISLRLKRSGKIIRKIAQAPPLYARSFNAPELEPNDRFGSFNHQAIKSAELVYILKPMIHLGAVGVFGYESWKSYLLSLFLDVFSIRQYYNNRQYLTSDQKKEMSRRCVNMLLYILRSPFYDKYSASKIDSFMKAISATIPFAKLIVEPYRSYIPHYQESYFYMWSS